ncbi:short-chain dehydrogenase/reductase SDR [Gloeothece citriformis PCC 7424]|uniref:Short-chain dehydrogenase/reductase SDR n=1 Tax=Gloeothece citriformis (strain PCC 7424) TaxID=65393 RepID=B7KKH4_GLOC7|nr:glucose 1-dehydrogenase [Gloeothece citriformis]ACK72307.1 short-chain dehydrogenase/reductase SDR [Gloeothece citriformis PCC 7424]
MKGLKGKNVLVTGASSGIGQAIAIRFAQEGCNIAINYRKSAEKAKETEVIAMQKACGELEKCGIKTVLIEGDVSQEQEIITMVNQVVEKFGSLDILINNAGIQIEKASHEVAGEEFDRVLAVNLRGAYFCAREAINHFLLNGGGVIINISSVHEIIPRPCYISYSISKGGMKNLTKTLALEYADRNIRVNAIAPGATITPINEAWVNDAEKRILVESHIPMNRAGTTEEMAAAAAFLASEEASYITGQTLFIDGGLTLYADFRETWSA